MKKENVLEGVGTTRPANISICINMPIIIKCVRWQGKSEGTSIHEAKHPATADRRHCRTQPVDLVTPCHPHTPPVDLATPCHPHTESSGQETPDPQSPPRNLAVERAMPGLRQSRRIRRPHGDRAIPPDRSQQSRRQHHTPQMGRGSDGQRAASSGSPRLVGRHRQRHRHQHRQHHRFVRTIGGPGRDTGRRT